jgi:hypothetical protein
MVRTRSNAFPAVDSPAPLTIIDSRRKDLIIGHVEAMGAMRGNVVVSRTKKRDNDWSCVWKPSSRTSSGNCSSPTVLCSKRGSSSLSPALRVHVLRRRTSRSCALVPKNARASNKTTDCSASLLRCGKLPGVSLWKTEESKASQQRLRCRLARHECASRKEDKISESEGERSGPIASRCKEVSCGQARTKGPAKSAPQSSP